jgi:hypothetical protein
VGIGAEIGSVDRITSVVGERGTGKSTYAIHDAREFRNATGAIVIGHSPNGQIGAQTDIVFHDSLRSLDTGKTRSPEKMHFIASGASPEEVIAFGRSLSLIMRRAAVTNAGHRFQPNRPAPPGIFARPVLIVVDEGTHLAKRVQFASRTAALEAKRDSDEEMEQFLTSARHEHIAFTMLIQAPTRRSWIFQEQSNRFRVFRYTHEWGSNALRAAGIPKEELDSVRSLERFHYLAWDKESPTDYRWGKVEPAETTAPPARKYWWQV